MRWEKIGQEGRRKLLLKGSNTREGGGRLIEMEEMRIKSGEENKETK